MPNQSTPVPDSFTNSSIKPSIKQCEDAVTSLESYGMYPLALAELTASEQKLLNSKNRFVCILGNIGSSIWPHFSQSREFKDRVTDPLDTWSKRLLHQVFAEGSNNGDGNLVFPSDGPPYAPFQKWAFRSGLYWTSPISIGLHVRHGLWTAFRGAVLLNKDQALVFEKLMAVDEIEPVSPCLSCKEKPCLTTCPVDAFKLETDTQSQSVTTAAKRLYDVESCRKLVLEQSVHSQRPGAAFEASCFDGGCLARRACPVGKHLVYENQHARFHMERLISPRQIAVKTT